MTRLNPPPRIPVNASICELTEPLLTGQRPRECDAVSPAARGVEGGEVGVVLGHGDGPALRVDRVRGVAGAAVQDRVGEALKCNVRRVEHCSFE